MINVNEEFHMEYSDEVSNAISEFAILIGDNINQMAPLEKYYALQMICEEIAARTTLYCVMGSLAEDVKNDKTNGKD